MGIAGGCSGAMGIAGGVGAQWELPGAVERETGAILSLSGCGRGISTPPRRRSFWPDGGPSCTLPDRREAAVLQRRCPRSCAPRTFSASPSGRPSVGSSLPKSMENSKPRKASFRGQRHRVDDDQPLPSRPESERGRRKTSERVESSRTCLRLQSVCLWDSGEAHPPRHRGPRRLLLPPTHRPAPRRRHWQILLLPRWQRFCVTREG